MSDMPRTRRQHSAAPADAPAASALITSAPVPWTATRSAAPAALDGQLGWDTPRPSLHATPGAIRTLETSGDVLPELEEAPQTQRPLWRHPAFLISSGTTLLALIAFGVFVLLGGLSGDSAAADLRLEVTDNVVRASWSGPDVPYQLIVIDGPSGPALDVSQLVTGTEAWLPLAASIVDEGSCIIVRPVEGNEEAPVKLDRAVLDGQRGVSGCVSDAAQE